MKIYSLLIACCIFLLACSEKKEPTNIVKNNSKKIVYDSVLAAKVGADDYGMKKYVMAFLKRGPNRDQDSITKINLQRGHMDNISRLAEEGKLVLAGPYFGNDDLRGIYIFNVNSIEEAKNLTETDPAIKAGSLIMELKEWYGSAGLVLLNDVHKTLAKKGI